MDKLILADLETETAVVLPSREVMSFFNLTFLSARNRATAVQQVTAFSLNSASANQTITVTTS